MFAHAPPSTIVSMRAIKFFLALAATIGTIWLLQNPQTVGDKRLPALGQFLNPFTGFWRSAEPITGPNLATTLSLPGLSGKVEVVYDDLLVPHIFAQNVLDAARAQGYITAQHRLWQMDIVTRRASGRLAEVVGRRGLESDRMMRRRGMVFAAENELKAAQGYPDIYQWIEAYTAGVNAWVEQLRPADYPIEFKLMSYQPEPWTPLKTALVLESMADNLSAREEDIATTNAFVALGKATFDNIYPEWDEQQTPIVPDIGQWKGIQSAASKTPVLPTLSSVQSDTHSQLTLTEEEQLPASMRPLNGSNNWAVASSRTANGHTFLANDPHLGLTLPSIWYQTHLHTPEQNTYGVALAGIPGIIIGFNDYVAWGVTNVSHDVADWYKIKWTDASRTQYLLDGVPTAATLRIETFKIVGEEKPLLDTVRYTVWGPVVHHDPKHPLYDCALRWVTHDQPSGPEMALSRLLNMAKNHAEHVKAIQAYECPAQNFVFATRGGDIAMQVQGKYPLRAPQQGRFVQDGSQKANAWAGFIPANDVPKLLNPSWGYVYSANQNSAAKTYPYYYLGVFDHFRGRRIHDRLEALKNATVDSMKAMQLDNFSYRAAEGLPALLRLLNRQGLDANATHFLGELEHWNYHYDADAIAPSLFEMWFDSTYVRTWDEMEAIRQQKKQVAMPETWRFIQMLRRDTSHQFFDRTSTPQRETARDIVTAAFAEMVQNATAAQTKGTLAWAKMRGFTLRHLSQIDAFSRPDLLVGGHRNAPNAISKTHGPSWRMIVDLSAEDIKGYGVYPGGQSGNPSSRFYDNMVEAWLKGDYYELLRPNTPDGVPSARVYARQTLQ